MFAVKWLGDYSSEIIIAMLLNLPANRLLKLTKGRWQDVKYPVTAIVQVQLHPRDFFEPVELTTARSCAPVGGTSFSYLLDANSGRMTLRGPTMFPPLSVTFDVNGGAWNVIFVGSMMQVTQIINESDEIDTLLTHVDYTIPSLVSLSTGLAIYPQSVEIGLGEHIEARSETLIPLNQVRVLDEVQRIPELRRGIELLGIALPSARFTLAVGYLREALFFDSNYNDHNPYTQALSVILKCAQSIEVLFGSKRDAIRERCRLLEIPDAVVESHFIPVVLARSELGSAHASSFVPSPDNVDVIRAFATRSVNNVRQLLLYISRLAPDNRSFLRDAVGRNPEKEKLIEVMRRSLAEPRWSVAGDAEERAFVVVDPRLRQT